MRGAQLCALMLAAGTAAGQPRTVHFLSEDHQTKLVGYLFEPAAPGPHPAVVLLHGRGGPYSSLANGVYGAATLSKRHKEWGARWAEDGYVALLVDSFGPRGYGGGFPKGSYENRPAAVSEQTVRPLDAYGALRYLRGRKDVIPDRVGVHGWSNGAMTVLVTMSSHTPGIEHPTPESGFRVGLAEYPGCGMEAIQGDYRPYAPLLMMVGTADEEVSPQRCQEFAARVKRVSANLELVVYNGAEHNYDDPGKEKQSNAANRRATEDTIRRAERLFDEHLKR